MVYKNQAVSVGIGNIQLSDSLPTPTNDMKMLHSLSSAALLLSFTVEWAPWPSSVYRSQRRSCPHKHQVEPGLQLFYGTEVSRASCFSLSSASYSSTSDVLQAG